MAFQAVNAAYPQSSSQTLEYGGFIVQKPNQSYYYTPAFAGSQISMGSNFYTQYNNLVLSLQKGSSVAGWYTIARSDLLEAQALKGSVALYPNFFTDTSARQAGIVVHENFHVYTRWNDANVFYAFQHRGITPSEVSQFTKYGNTDGITTWILRVT